MSGLGLLFYVIYFLYMGLSLSLPFLCFTTIVSTIWCVPFSECKVFCGWRRGDCLVHPCLQSQSPLHAAKGIQDFVNGGDAERVTSYDQWLCIGRSAPTDCCLCKSEMQQPETGHTSLEIAFYCACTLALGPIQAPLTSEVFFSSLSDITWSAALCSQIMPK